MKRRIIIAFLVVAIVPAALTIVAANWFARQELEGIRRHNAEAGLARLDANVVEVLAAMGSAAKNEAGSQRWLSMFLRKQELGAVFQAQLINELVDRTKQARWDFSAILDTTGVVLARGDFASGFGDTVDFRHIFAVRDITKPMAAATVPFLPVWGTGGLLGIAPITWQQKKLGYFLVGASFTAEHLRNWVGGWAIPAVIVDQRDILNMTEDVPERQFSEELLTQLYQGPKVASAYFAGRRYLVAREKLTDASTGKTPLMILLFFDSAPVDLAVEKLLYSLLGAGGLGVLLALVFGVLAARLLTRPLEDISQAARRISRGEWDADVISFSGGEAGRMADAFNRMIADLRRSRERLIQTERLATYRDAARKVAHEIKNPLSPIRVSAEDLLSSYKPDDPGFEPILRQAVKTITEETAAIKRFLDEFTSFARLPRPVFALVRVDELLAEAADAFPAEKKAGRVATRADGDLGITADSELLRQALVNLIKNGLEAAGPNGNVTVTAAKEDDGVTLTVEDTGPGFSDEVGKKLFTPFITTKPGGTGLGLVIVQGIVVDHGGTITAENRPEGGARVTIHLSAHPPVPKHD